MEGVEEASPAYEGADKAQEEQVDGAIFE